MHTTPRLWAVIAACVMGSACGGPAAMLTAPPSSELALAVTLNPDAVGGIRPSTIVSAMLFVEPFADRIVVGGTLERAEFAVFDGQGTLLVRETVAGPLSFEPNGTLTVRKALDWTPADVLGRSLRVRFVLPEGATLHESTLAF